MSYTVAMLNTIRMNASTDYQTRVPVATKDNLTLLGQALTTYTPTFNEFTDNLIGKIGLTLVSSKLATNRLARFKKGMLPFGKDVEEIFVEMVKAEGKYDPTGTNPMGRRKPDVSVVYHRESRQDQYAISVSREQVLRAFTSEQGVADLVSAIVQSMYSGANHDEYIIMKELLAKNKASFKDYGITAITNEATAKAFVKTLRKAVNDVGFMSKLHNPAGKMQQSEAKDLVLVINKDVVSEVDIEVLSKAFNMGKTDFTAEVLPIDDFGSMTDTYAILVDKEFMQVYDTLFTVESIRNPQGLFTNYFLHVHQILSISPYKNQIRFTTVPKV